jgi:hypothetical protein
VSQECEKKMVILYKWKYFGIKLFSKYNSLKYASIIKIPVPLNREVKQPRIILWLFTIAVCITDLTGELNFKKYNNREILPKGTVLIPL